MTKTYCDGCGVETHCDPYKRFFDGTAIMQVVFYNSGSDRKLDLCNTCVAFKLREHAANIERNSIK